MKSVLVSALFALYPSAQLIYPDDSVRFDPNAAYVAGVSDALIWCDTERYLRFREDGFNLRVTCDEGAPTS